MPTLLGPLERAGPVTEVRSKDPEYVFPFLQLSTEIDQVSKM
jgi:hypothetical protein